MLYRAEALLPTTPEHAWAILVDFERYPEWNPFTPEVRIDQLRVGGLVDMRVELKGSRRQREHITRWDPDQHRIAWGMSYPLGVVRAERIQRIEACAEGARYVTEDRIEGPAAGLVERLYGDALRAGFAAMAQALRARASASAPPP